MCSQGYSSKVGGRLSTLESRQKEMEVTMSAMAGSISAMETQGDTPPRSLPIADRGLLGLSPSNAAIISTESSLEGERRTEGVPPTTSKQEPRGQLQRRAPQA
jgi:hypothetical protein